MKSMEMKHMSLGTNISYLRKQKKLTQEHVDGVTKADAFSIFN